MYSFEALFLWSFCRGQFPKVNKRRIYHSQCFTVATCRKSLDGFVSQKQSLFGRSAWNPDTKLPIIVCRLLKFYNEVTQILKVKPVQNQNSKLCGLFCIYIAHVMFAYEYPLMLNMNDNDLLRFANHML